MPLVNPKIANNIKKITGGSKRLILTLIWLVYLAFFFRLIIIDTFFKHFRTVEGCKIRKEFFGVAEGYCARYEFDDWENFIYASAFFIFIYAVHHLISKFKK